MTHHVAIKVAKAEISRVLSILSLCPGLEVDDQLKLSTLEGETELNEIVSALLAANEDDEGMIEANKTQIAVRNERIARFEHRIESRKSAIISLMDCAQITKLPLAEATVTLRTLGARAKVYDEEALPDDFCKFVRKPDTKKINAAFEAGQSVPGVTVTNGGASLSVRRK